MVSWNAGASYAVNMTSWAPLNSAGQRYPQFKAQYDHAAYLAGRSGVDYVLSANTWARPRVDADWRRIGTNQLRTDPTIQAAMRAGQAAYWQALRVRAPSVRIMGGLDNSNDLSSPEHKGQLDGAHLDGLMGKDWSLEALGWQTMMARYRAVIANTRGDKLVIFSVYGASPTDYARMRYGLASTLLDSGHFMFRPSSGSSVPAWYEEYAAPLGAPVDAPPLAPKAAGVYVRRFQNGIVLVNPQATQATIDIGTGYQRLNGTQDPVVNNGQAQRFVTLGPRSGLLMLKTPRPCVKTNYSRPKIAALDYSRDISAANEAFLARFRYVIVALGSGQGLDRLRSFTSGLRLRNPSIGIAQYVIHNEMLCEMPSSHDYYDQWLDVQKADWWLRDASGARSQWTTIYGSCDINVTKWGTKNAAGQTWAEYKWQRDWNVFFRNMPAVDHVHVDNMMYRYRKDADFRRVGTNQPYDDPVYEAAWREGMMAYVRQVRALAPQLKVSVNGDGDLSEPEFQRQFDKEFLEGMIGKSWSLENWGWELAMDRYRTVLRNVKTPGNAIFQAFTAPTDYALVRYALASAMLEDGYFMQTNSSGGQRPSWFDEFDAPIGAPAETPPTAPKANGIWLRRYQNGLVLVNPSKTNTASISIGGGYMRLNGSQDPAVNDGRSESVVTLGPRSGLLMLRRR